MKLRRRVRTNLQKPTTMAEDKKPPVCCGKPNQDPIDPPSCTQHAKRRTTISVGRFALAVVFRVSWPII